MPDYDEMDEIIEAGVIPVVAALVAALVFTFVDAVIDGSTVAHNMAWASWVVFTFVFVTWVAIVLLDYWVPVKAEPVVLPDSVRNLPLDSDPLDPPIV